MAFEQGLSGLSAASKNLDVIGNNVANVNTVGFKESEAHFADIYASAGGLVGENTPGIGTRVSAIAQSFSQGSLTATSNPLDLAINGNGFFRLSDNGAVEYSRNGQFHLDKNGYVVNDSGSRLTGYSADANGNIVQTASPTDLQISQSDVAPQTTTKVAADISFAANATPITAAFDPTVSTTYTSSNSATVYDSLGNGHALDVYVVPGTATAGGEQTWKVYATNDGTQIGTGPVGTLTFTSEGAIDTANSTIPFTISTPVTGGAQSPLAFTLDLTGSTNYATPDGKAAFNQLTQDGFSSGRLSSYSVSDDGTILGRYSNGQTKPLAQVAIANFTSPEGLSPLGNNVWAQSAKSGTPVVGIPGTGSLGALQSGTIEESNVDLTAQLVDMITAQRNYQANAQTIKTEDALMQTLVNLR